MPLNITIDSSSTANGSERSHSNSFSDGDSSGTGVHVSPSSGVGSQEYAESLDGSEAWVEYTDEIGPSDSASRPRTSNQHRVLRDVRPRLPHRQSSRRGPSDRLARHQLHRAHRPPAPIAPDSVESSEDYPPYARGHPPTHVRIPGHWRVSDGPAAHYAPSYASSGSYEGYPGNSMVPVGPNQLMPVSPHAGYGYPPNAFSPGPAPPTPGYFPPTHPGAPPMSNPVSPRPGHPYSGQDMLGYGPGAGYYYGAQAYGMPPGMTPHMFYPYQVAPSPSNTSTPPPPPATSSKDDEKFARLEKLLIDQKLEADEKEARAQKAAEERELAAKKAAEEIAAAKQKADAEATKKAMAAAELAKTEAKAEAELAKAEAEAAKAEVEATKAKVAANAKPKEEKKKPIKFKDAVGRKFSFPFHLCATWQGIEELIKQAFRHVDVIGPHVAEGHYDLIGPNGDIILPQVWETTVEPDWTITMKMWPIPEPPAAPAPADAAKPDQVVLVGPGKTASLVKGDKPKPPPPPAAPGGGGTVTTTPAGVVVVGGSGGGPKKGQQAKLPPLLMWTRGGRYRQAKKVEKKPEESIQHDVVCRVM